MRLCRMPAPGRPGRSRERGFGLVELAVAAVVLFIAAAGVVEALAASVRNLDRHQKDMVAERVVLSAINDMRSIGYAKLVASGSQEISRQLSALYAPQLQQLGDGAAVSISWANRSGQLLDATVSASFPVVDSTSSRTLVTVIGSGSPP